jgi:hypothetical protein
MVRIACIFFLLFILSCSENKTKVSIDNNLTVNTIDNSSWITGSWIDSTTFKSFNPPKSMFENWVKYSDSLVGVGGFISDSDTVATEKLLVLNVENNLVYIARPKERAMISFSLKSSSKDSIVFENKAHDFPTTITYQKITNDSMLVYLRGISSDQQREFRLSYSRF